MAEGEGVVTAKRNPAAALSKDEFTAKMVAAVRAVVTENSAQRDLLTEAQQLLDRASRLEGNIKARNLADRIAAFLKETTDVE